MNSEEVFILGSGFSKAINENMPTLSDLGKKINFFIKNDKTEDENKKSLNNFYKKIIIKKGINNFEEILTLLYQDFPWKETKERYLFKSLYFYVTELLLKLLNDNQIKVKVNYSNNDVLVSFINYIKEHRSVIITFNYDTILETVTNQMFKGNFLTINDIYPINLEELIPIKAQIVPKLDAYKLYKLHGSINWFYRHDENDQTYNRIFLKQGTGEDIEKALKGMVPFIVPPVFDKSSFINSNIIETLWKEAREEISNAKKIYIIGYSLPESDLITRLMLKQNVNKLSKVFIINNDIRIKSRIKKDFNKFSINTDYVVKDPNIIFKFFKEQLLYK